jgi:hypothetical protein
MSYIVKELLESISSEYRSREEWEKDVSQKHPDAVIKTAHETNQAPYGSYHNTVHAVIKNKNGKWDSVGHFSSTYGSGKISK